jgi:serine/threonine protein kinase
LYQAAWRELKLLKALPPHPHVVYTFDAFDDRKEQQGGDSDGKETANEAPKTITGSEGSGPAAKDKTIQVETPAKEEVEGDDYLSSIAQKQQQRTLQQLQQQKQQQQQRRAAQLPPPRLFVVACLELVRGPTLLAMLQAGGALDVGLCRVVAAQLVSALGFLHSHSVVHRYLTTQNTCRASCLCVRF